MDVSGSPSRLTLYCPVEIVLAWLIGRGSPASGPAELGLVQPKRVEKHGKFAGYGGSGLPVVLAFGKALTPLLERKRSLDSTHPMWTAGIWHLPEVRAQ